MSTRVRELLATRTVAVRYPHGETEYWFTDKEFVEGDTLSRNGQAWVVESVLTAAQTGDKFLIRLAEIESAA
jgi:hypothetical protein